MKITIPVSHADATRLPLLVDVLLHHGNLGNHNITLYPTAVVAAAAQEASTRLRTACYDVSVHVLDNFDGGWPKAPNAHWASVAMHLHASGNQHPWLWLEVDAVPMVSQWANELQQRYNACGKPLMGPVRQTVYRNEDGSVYHIDGDEMLLGVAMYPNWILNVTELKPLMNDFLKLPDQAPEQPFDVYLRWAFKRMGWEHTDAIKHCWRSTQFSGGTDALAYVEGSIPGQTDATSTLILHGCKDESLYNLILNPAKTSPATQFLAKDSLDEVIAEGVKSQLLFNKMESLLSGAIEETERNQPQQRLAESVSEALEAAAVTKQPQPAPEAPQQPLSRFLLGPVTPAEEAAWPCTKQQFEEWLGTHSKAVRLRAMLEKFGFDKLDTCRRAIGFWGYEAPTPATFIRRKK